MADQITTAYDAIKDRILSNVYKPAQKLVETDLCDSLGVSRNTVKLALVRLEKEKLVEIQRNRGAVVRSFSLDEVLNYFDIRISLEKLIARSAAEHISDSELERLHETLAKMEACLERGELTGYSALNQEFHQTIYESCKNPQAVELVMMIKTQLLRYHFRTILIPGRNDHSIREHTDIYRALAAHNADVAEKAIETHIHNVKSTVKDHFEILI